jgi:hypothetical protein
MPRWNGDDVPAPLPRDLLPEASPREGTPEWEANLARVLATTQRELSELRGREVRLEPSWPAVLGSWWKPAVALAGAAVAALVVLSGPAEPDAGAVPLNVVVTEGDPAALFAGLGVPADPVLALIAAQSGTP